MAVRFHKSVRDRVKALTKITSAAWSSFLRAYVQGGSGIHTNGNLSLKEGTANNNQIRTRKKIIKETTLQRVTARVKCRKSEASGAA